jgi:hypothetical protein
MKKKPSEANLLGFRIVIDSKGSLLTEMSGVPEKDLPKAFAGDDLRLMRQIQRLLRPKIQELHKFLEDEISALNHPA